MDRFKYMYISILKSHSSSGSRDVELPVRVYGTLHHTYVTIVFNYSCIVGLCCVTNEDARDSR